jgi:2-polyprenyl-3-methyl-5-hydroxy-6-metoxy-1,4-benzoquinol methylase
MAFEALQSMAQIRQARAELERSRLSFIQPEWLRFLSRKILNRLNVGDRIKSWDVLKTTRFLEQHVPRDEPVLDIGAYASEIICILHRLGYSRLAGVDLNPRLNEMPFADFIDYRVSDFMTTPFTAQSFAVITAISVIEHGFQPAALLTEVTRLLKPGGLFIASFDYWPEKIDTSDMCVFDLSWTIFSQPEVQAFVAQAQLYNLVPYGTLDYMAARPIMTFAGRHYTFAWLALTKVK